MTTPIQPSYVSIDMVASFNTGSHSTPTWAVINCRDVKRGLKLGEADVSNRGSVEQLAEPTLLGREFQLDLIPDETDTVYTALRSAALARTPIELAFANGPIGTSGSSASGGTAGVVYSRHTLKIFGWDENQPLADAVVTTATLKPCKLAQTNASANNVIIT